MKKLLLIVCFFTTLLLLTVCAQAQSVKGKVFDASTGNPIPNASIYLNGSSKGTASNAAGEFTLYTTETNIPLVISCVGYQTQTINNYSNKTLSIALRPRPQVLGEVVIGGMSREEQLKMFIKQFIGSLSKDCTISNTEDINLSYHKKTKTLKADASQPLIIYNKKLGYKITYFLSAFKLTPEEIFYEGNYFFEEDTLGRTPNDVKKIIKARDNAYFGSRMHFIRSLWANDLAKNRIIVSDYNTLNKPASSDNDSEEKHPYYNSLIKVRNGQKYIAINRTVAIKHRGAVSNLALDKGVKEVIIGSNGYHGPQVIWSGDMSEQRINVLLPFQFEPAKPLSTLGQPTILDRQVITDPLLARMIVHQDSFLKYHNPEKLYVQTDKPHYTTGDTIRFKAYLVNADYLLPAKRTGLLYVELDDHAGKFVKRMMVPVTTGMAWGDIVLDEVNVPNGTYTLRAYTNWMRNFGEDYIFKKDIYISSRAGNATLVKANFKQQGNRIESTLQFVSLDGRRQILNEMDLRLMLGKRNLLTNKLVTGMDGSLKLNFDLPQPTTKENLVIVAKNVTRGATDEAELTIPVTIHQSEYTDIQFMPEGGAMVAGIPSKIGFKAIGEDGKGVTISGKITDSKAKEVATIKTTHAGMGSWEFTPKAGEVYTAKFNGITKSYPLPVVNPQGTTLRIQQSTNEDDSLKVIVSTSTEFTVGTYYLVGQARGVVCHAQVIKFDSKQQVKRSVAKEWFPTGIARFTLLDANRQPLNERQVYIDHNDKLNISVATDKSTYSARDSIVLAIEVKDKNGDPIQGAFSLAVTDDSQVKIDSMCSNILSSLLLTSDLKGDIEEPGYYFTNTTKQKQTDLDNLMLTQGWVGYDWKDILKPIKPLPYQAEKEFTIKGKVSNAFNKQLEETKVRLLSINPFILRDTTTDNEGKFVFKNLFPIDTAIYKLQALNKNGKSFNVGMEVEEFKPPHFTVPLGVTPWYVNSDTTIIKNSLLKASQQHAEADYQGQGKMLKEVTIKDIKVIRGSKNLNGSGNADQVVDEHEIEKAGKMMLTDLLQQKIKGFNAGWDNYYIFKKPIHFIIDGLDLDFYYPQPIFEMVMTKNGLVKAVPMAPPRDHFFYIKSYLDYFTAEDITGMEVMYNQRYNSKYTMEHIKESPPPIDAIAFVEITTRSKQGPFMRTVPGTYLYKPLAFKLPKQFYSPKYTVKNKNIAMGTDMRSTLHWEANVITDRHGRANVSFFTADKPANYTLIIEGATGEGELGYSRHSIKNIASK